MAVQAVVLRAVLPSVICILFSKEYTNAEVIGRKRIYHLYGAV